MNVCEIYGFNDNPYGVADLSDPDLAKRDRALENEIGWLVRTLERFENFCDAIDLSGLGEHAVETLYDNAAGLDWSLIETGKEHDAVLAEIHCRREAETAPVGDPTRINAPDWFLDD